MKKLVLLAMMLGTANMYGQNLSNNYLMTQLPRTSDDFQKYQFDYKLECAVDVGYDYTISSDNSNFDGTGIFALEHNETPIKEIECVVNDLKGKAWIPTYELDAKFTSSGKIASYKRSISSTANYRFGTDSWSKWEWNKADLIPCIPNAYAYWTRPTRNSKGLIISVGDELKYNYDSQDRVIEVSYRGNEFIYRYTYVGNSKNIKTITVYGAELKRADASYSYTNGLLTNISCNMYYKHNQDLVETHYEKSYKYNEHNDISEMDFVMTNSSTSTNNYKFDNQYDSKGRLLVSNVSYFKDKMRGRISHTRKYTYDDKGNWIKIEQENQYGEKCLLARKITYKKSAFSIDEIAAISNPRDLAQKGLSYARQGREAEDEGQDRIQYYEIADELFEKASLMDETIANHEVILTRWLETKIYLNDYDNAATIASQLLKQLSSKQDDDEEGLEKTIMSYIPVCAYYRGIKDDKTYNSCWNRTMEKAKKLLRVNPNNNYAKYTINFLNKNH